MSNEQGPLTMSEEDVEQLEELLVSDEVPGDCMNLEMLDGYLAAVVAAPVVIPVEKWLPGVWSAEEEDVSFGSGSAMQKAIELVLRYYNELATTIGREEDGEDGEDGDGEEAGLPMWQPFCYAPGDEDDPGIGQEWISGFEQGFELWPDEWPEQLEDSEIAESLLETVFGDEEDDEDASSADAEEQLFALEEKGLAVQRLYQYWRTLGLPAAGPVEVAGAAGAAKAGPGRNEPCPCGSGKKYKKCCGAN